jgi:hypothetical protein
MKTIILANGLKTIVDDVDFVRFGAMRWYFVGIPGQGYAAPSRKGITEYLHRLIVGDPKGLQVDHKNGDKLDNRRSNLRPCTPTQNSQNRRRRIDNKSGVTGVYFRKNKRGPCKRRWRALIRVNKKTFASRYFQH